MWEAGSAGLVASAVLPWCFPQPESQPAGQGERDRAGVFVGTCRGPSGLYRCLRLMLCEHFRDTPSPPHPWSSVTCRSLLTRDTPSPILQPQV